MSERVDYRHQVLAAVQREESFLQMVLSQNADRAVVPWTKVNVRPVEIRGRRHMQFSYFDGRQVTHKNYAGEELRRELERALSWPFRQIHVQTTEGDLHVRISKKGKVFVSRGRPAQERPAPALGHDRVKERPLSLQGARPFLEALGIVDGHGRVRPGMGAKFHQVNEFLRFIERAVEGLETGRPVRVVDCGCGRAYLTFAAYHYLNEVRGLEAHLQGVDVNAEILQEMSALRDELGWDKLTFHATTIAAFQPATTPDLVLSLHACDTATDEALAQAVRWGSSWILAAPCCQHELYDRLHDDLFRPVLRHGILRQRLADLLTDAFRALILRILGYSTQVVEFVSPEHTSKNLMIVAERGLPKGDAQMAGEYRALKGYWHATPALETMLKEELDPYIG
ncbi:MAG: SAM-dependent methyltransferase [Chloroflexi bacterium]|nr:SAM-dependent methyltransferase [Chloroflexota bacterium]